MATTTSEPPPPEEFDDFDEETEYSDDVDNKSEQHRIIYAEEKLMTPEERAERNALRLSMSGCCVKEAWEYYRKLTLAPKLREDTGEEDSQYARPLSVVYDPDVDRRRAYLGQRYRYMLDGFHKIKEAPSKPYIRPQPPRDMNIPGRRLYLPHSARKQMPEHDVDYSEPKSISAKGTTLKIYNKAFVDDVTTADDEAQTFRSDVNEHCRKWVKRKDWVTTRDIPMEAFDLEDIPLDEMGNPIGKSVGYCHFCNGDILPLPTPWEVNNTWNKDMLYCCREYRKWAEDIAEIEADLEEEHRLENLIIDVGRDKDTRAASISGGQRSSLAPSSQRKGQGHGQGQGQGQGEGQGQGQGGEDQPRTSRITGSTRPESTKSSINNVLMEERARRKQSKAEILMRQKMMKMVSMGIDTRDLPWDPYESRFNHDRIFNDELFDEAAFHIYPHADVVMAQEGVFESSESLSKSKTTGTKSSPTKSSPTKSSTTTPTHSTIEDSGKHPRRKSQEKLKKSPSKH